MALAHSKWEDSLEWACNQLRMHTVPTADTKMVTFKVTTDQAEALDCVLKALANGYELRKIDK